MWQMPSRTKIESRFPRICLTLTGVQNLDAHFVRLGRRDLDVLELERLACTPADGGLALDDFTNGVRHSIEERGLIVEKEERRENG